jgi:hypothetical protein
MAAHLVRLPRGTGGRWLTLAAEMAGLTSGNGQLSPDTTAVGWTCLPRIATCTPAAGAGSVRAARDFTVATLHRWSAGERCQDIAVVVSELLTNALRHALPGSGEGRPRRPVRLGLLQLRPCVLCGRGPEHSGSGAATARCPRRDRPRPAYRLRAQRRVGLHDERHREGRVGHVHRTANGAVCGKVSQHLGSTSWTSILTTRKQAQPE